MNLNRITAAKASPSLKDSHGPQRAKHLRTKVSSTADSWDLKKTKVETKVDTQASPYPTVDVESVAQQPKTLTFVPTEPKVCDKGKSPPNEVHLGNWALAVVADKFSYCYSVVGFSKTGDPIVRNGDTLTKVTGTFQLFGGTPENRLILGGVISNVHVKVDSNQLALAKAADECNYSVVGFSKTGDPIVRKDGTLQKVTGSFHLFGGTPEIRLITEKLTK